MVWSFWVVWALDELGGMGQKRPHGAVGVSSRGLFVAELLGGPFVARGPFAQSVDLGTHEVLRLGFGGLGSLGGGSGGSGETCGNGTGPLQLQLQSADSIGMMASRMNISREQYGAGSNMVVCA